MMIFALLSSSRTSEPGALDDVATPGSLLEFPLVVHLPRGRRLPAAGNVTRFEEEFERHRACGRETGRRHVSSIPADGDNEAAIESGSSPVAARYAAGICRRRGTPSFCRRTSLCAFAVLAEIPSRSPTSSLEQPAAMRATTCRWRAVIPGIACFRTSYMAGR